MTILRSGTTKNYSDNWSAAFGAKRKKPKAAASAQKKSKPTKKATKKSKKK
jgi:hypothetical protein